MYRYIYIYSFQLIAHILLYKTLQATDIYRFLCVDRSEAVRKGSVRAHFGLETSAPHIIHTLSHTDKIYNIPTYVYIYILRY